MFVVLHTAKRNSLSHRKHGRIICGHPSNAKKKLVRSKEETGSEYLRIHNLRVETIYHMQNAMTLSP